jgi:hypothetical protein
MAAKLPGGIVINFDYRGIGEIARSPWLQGLVADAAHAVAGQLGGDDVFVDTYTTDRAAASVTVYGSRAVSDELLTGRITDAALSVGLEVGGR